MCSELDVVRKPAGRCDGCTVRSCTRYNKYCLALTMLHSQIQQIRCFDAIDDDDDEEEDAVRTRSLLLYRSPCRCFDWTASACCCCCCCVASEWSNAVVRRNVSVEASNTLLRCFDTRRFFRRFVDTRCFARHCCSTPAPRCRLLQLLVECHDLRPRSQYVLDVGDTLV